MTIHARAYAWVFIFLGLLAATVVDELFTPESRDSYSGNAVRGSASPRTLKSPLLKPKKSNSPANFIKPAKTVGVKHPRRRSSKYHAHSKKKLLNTSKSTNVLTPNKLFVAPMKSLQKSTSHSKLQSNNVVKPTSSKNDENLHPQNEANSS